MVESHADCLAALDRAHCLYATTDRPPPLVTSEARAYVADTELWLLEWALIGQRSKHEWCKCHVCHEVRLMKTPPGPRSKSPAIGCDMTPRCAGHMVRIAKPPRLTQKLLRVLRGE